MADDPVQQPPPCCKDGHAFEKFTGILWDTLVCMRCGKKVKHVGV